MVCDKAECIEADARVMTLDERSRMEKETAELDAEIERILFDRGIEFEYRPK